MANYMFYVPVLTQPGVRQIPLQFDDVESTILIPVDGFILLKASDRDGSVSILVATTRDRHRCADADM